MQVWKDSLWQLWQLMQTKTDTEVFGTHTGWRRLVGCLKLQVIFCKRATNYRALLQKITIKISHPMRLRHPVVMITITYIANITLQTSKKKHTTFLLCSTKNMYNAYSDFDNSASSPLYVTHTYVHNTHQSHVQIYKIYIYIHAHLAHRTLHNLRSRLIVASTLQSKHGSVTIFAIAREEIQIKVAHEILARGVRYLQMWHDAYILWMRRVRPRTAQHWNTKSFSLKKRVIYN